MHSRFSGPGGHLLPASVTALGFGANWFLAPYAWRRLQERRLAELCRGERILVLTYDDGPSVSLTDKVLEMLERHKARATFFVVGQNAHRHPDIVARLLDAGHCVGSHTCKHSNAWTVDPFTATQDCAAGVRTVSELGGDGTLFRPPQGKATIAGVAYAALAGLRFAWWTIDSQDSWARRPPADVVEQVDAVAGGVVLMHDSHDFCTDEACVSESSHAEYVLDLTSRLLDLAKRRSLTLVTQDEVLRGARR